MMLGSPLAAKRLRVKLNGASQVQPSVPVMRTPWRNR